MNYYGAKELAASFRTVRKNTILVAEDIPEDKYSFCPAVGVRSIGETLAHLALSPQMQLQIHKVGKLKTLEGLNFPELMKQFAIEQAKPRTKAEVVKLLTEEGENFASWLESVSDEFLAEHVAFPQGMQPPSKSRFEMLLGTKEHEMHHRGQLMLAERLLGITPHLTRDMQARMAASAHGTQQK